MKKGLRRLGKNIGGRRGGGALNVKVEPHPRFLGVYAVTFEDGRGGLATKNLAPGRAVYGEKLVKRGEAEYRLWDPYRSKLAAAILKGLKSMPIKPGATVLYLGAGAGTTVSHVSDILGNGGKVYCVEFAPRAMRELINKVCLHRRNAIPILADARLPEAYPIPVPEVDAVYCDVAQPDQAKILADNAERYLKKGGVAMIALKARSIDVTKPPSELFEREIEELRGRGLKIEQSLRLEPYEKDHAFVVGRRA